MKGVGLLALVGFILANIVEHTPFALSEMQSAVVMLLILVGLAELLGKVFPVSSTRRVEKVTYDATVDVHPSTTDVPEWGTAPRYPLNPDAGKPEYNRFGQ